MPFELGVDYGCRQFFGKGRENKKFLILEEKQYRYMIAISDIAGCDIKAHSGEYEKAIREVRNWLVSEAGLTKIDGSNRIRNSYIDFQEWHYEEQLRLGHSEEDIQNYPTNELLESMNSWFKTGRPI